MDTHIVVCQQSIVVTIRGSMGVEEAHALRANLLSCIRGGLSTVVIKMADLQYIDSTGLGALSAINKCALKAGGKVTLSGLNGMVARLFHLSQLDQYFDIQN